ncbi:MAG: hypothetical protein II206_06310, partial [Bacteroidaceae bacterium]|nr:hypothetical protein [Bacteroidaceae bacterium]
MKKINALWLCAFLFAYGGCANQQTSQKMEEEEPSSQEVTEMEEDTAALQTVSEKDDIWYDGEIPFVFDAFKKYPITKIKLSELADPEYIALETNDSV